MTLLRRYTTYRILQITKAEEKDQRTSRELKGERRVLEFVVERNSTYFARSSKTNVFPSSKLLLYAAIDRNIVVFHGKKLGTR